MAGGKIQAIRSSLPYQVLLFCNGWYFGFFCLAELLIFIFKAETLPYPSGALLAEIVLIFIMAGLEAIRIFFGQKGNLTERAIAVILSLFLSIPSLFGAVYLLIWQTYVLRIEVILVVIELVFIGLEIVFALVSIITFSRATPY